jgi:[ribosomal protein S5]-alanine N-acetyltransferase
VQGWQDSRVAWEGGGASGVRSIPFDEAVAEMLRRSTPAKTADGQRQRIATSRLVLREFEESDWKATFEYQQDPGYLEFYPWPDRYDTDVRELIMRFITWSRMRPRHKYQLAITLASTGELIGNAGIRAEVPGALIAELGFELAPRCWGKGYATEAAMAMLEFGFRTLGLHRIEAHCVAENGASAAVLRRIGMRDEGRLRQAEYFKDRWWDVLLFGILDSDPLPAPPKGPIAG